MRAKHQQQVSDVEAVAAPWGVQVGLLLLTLPSFLFGLVFRKRDDAANVQQRREEDH